MNTRAQAKKIIKTCFLLLVSPLYGLYQLLSFLGRKDSVFQSISQMISLIPGKTGVYIRAAFYRLACPNTSDEISVGFLTILSHYDTTIGKGVYIGPQCNIGKCEIGDNTLIGSGVHILSGSRQHEFKNIEEPIQAQGGIFEKIRIGADCWLGNACIVMANLNDHSILAAGSVLTKPSAKGDILAGAPAKRIKNRFTSSPQPSFPSRQIKVEK